MKKTILLIACLFCAALCINAIAAEAATSQLTTLREDSGKNYTEMNFTLFSSLVEFGSLDIGEAVRFTAPKAGWKLQKVRVLAWSGYNESTEKFPADRNIMLEIRDKDLNILYKFADAQNNYFLSETGPLFGEIELPAVSVTGDFYVVFYDRGAAPIGMEKSNGTGSSFLISGSEIQPADFTTVETNETIAINWLIEAVGN
ncbi:MAG: hypothetical protein PHW87_01745 [Methanothrix sp.]|nr:hypothetical protein [Methanothrix sp.]